jgi:ribosome-binding factor A
MALRLGLRRPSLNEETFAFETASILRAGCGVNPNPAVRVRFPMKPRSRNQSQHRKARQLCCQVADTLNYVLGDDDSLAGLLVTSVEPAPDSTCLLVTLSPHLADEPLDSRAILARLDASAGRLRFEVASAITRRRAPRLLFRLVGAKPTT